MTTEEMIEEPGAADAVERVREIVTMCDQLVAGGMPTIALVLGKKAPSGERVRLAGRRGPLGDVLCVNSADELVARFRCDEVSKWLREQARLAGETL